MKSKTLTLFLASVTDPHARCDDPMTTHYYIAARDACEAVDFAREYASPPRTVRVEHVHNRVEVVTDATPSPA
jgi:hypothetical protein